jgi:hypothetical protein
MRCLEVFKGTGSVGKVFEAAGWEVISVDVEAKFEPTLCVDVLKWDYWQYPPGHFDYVHLSPPCTEYSKAMTKRPRNLALGDSLVDKALEILVYFRPRWWTLENPYTGMLKSRPAMQHLKPFMQRVCYCKYSEGDETWSYRKETAIWTNLKWKPRPLCHRDSPCQWFNGKAHPIEAQHLARARLYSMPPALIREWLAAILAEL